MDISPLSVFPQFLHEMARLHHREWGHLSPGFSVTARRNRLWELACEDGIPEVFVAYKEGRLIGSIALVNHDMTTRMDLTPWLVAVYVRATWRKRGM